MTAACAPAAADSDPMGFPGDKVKNAILCTLAIMIMAGCAPSEMTGSQPQSFGQQQEQEDHIGCQEGEVSIEGTCRPAPENNAGIFGQELDDHVDYAEIEGGFLAEPKEEGTYPGIIMIHEWWGLNDNIRDMAKILAKEGYIVYAVDLYDGEVAADSDRAGQLATAVRNNPDEAMQKLKGSAQYLRQEKNVQKIASLGWCFGGGQSLQLSLDEDLDATVIYYGQLIDDTTELQSISAPVLGIFGSEDSSIPPSEVRSFESALDSLNIQNDIYIYEGVGHAFANPSGSNYAREETLDAWHKTVTFLDENLK